MNRRIFMFLAAVLTLPFTLWKTKSKATDALPEHTGWNGSDGIYHGEPEQFYSDIDDGE